MTPTDRVANAMASNEALCAAARHWNPTNPRPVFLAIIDNPKSDLAKAFIATLKQGNHHGQVKG